MKTPPKKPLSDKVKNFINTQLKSHKKPPYETISHFNEITIWDQIRNLPLDQLDSNLREIAKELEIITNPKNYGVEPYEHRVYRDDKGLIIYGAHLVETPENWHDLAKETLKDMRAFYPADLLKKAVKYVSKDNYELLKKWTLELNSESNQVTPINEVKTTNVEKIQEVNNYQLITDNYTLTKLVQVLSKAKVLGIDTETTGLDCHLDKLRLIQIATPKNPTYLIDCFQCDVKLIQPLLTTEAIKIFHNAKFDLQFFLKQGLEINQKIFDTQIAYQLLTNKVDKTKLKDICQEYLNIDLDKTVQVSNWSSNTLTDTQLEYAAKDAEVLLLLRDIFKEKLTKADLSKIAKIEFETTLTVAMMEFNGMLLDLAKWQNIIKETEKKRNEIAQKLQQLLKSPSQENTLFEIETLIDLESPKQVKEALNNKGINVTDTAFNTLANLAADYQEIHLLLEYRKVAKLLSSFGQNLISKINPVTGRLHPNYFQCGASSGRFSCTNPNLQQIPRGKEIRSCFIASPGAKLVIADYSQIELRIAAEIANDTDMITAYKQGEDLHKLTASIILNKSLAQVTKEDRQIAKSANFGLLYGAGVNGFRNYAQNNYGINLTEKQAKDIKDRFFKRYQGLAKWHKQTTNNVYGNKQQETKTLMNRRRVFSELSLNQALNTPVQGTGADILKLALANLPSALKNTEAKILATVHDEIILECPENEADTVAKILSEVMITAGQEVLFKTPVECEASLADNWSEKS